MGKILKDAIERTKRINVRKFYKGFEMIERKSNEVLVDDYVTRSNIFRDIYSPEDKYRRFTFSAANLISNIDIIEFLLKNELSVLTKDLDTLATFRHYLEWCFLMDSGDKRALEFPDLYEPLIRLHERGAYLFKRHGEIFCGDYIWDNYCYNKKRSELLVDFSDEALDKFDL